MPHQHNKTKFIKKTTKRIVLGFLGLVIILSVGIIFTIALLVYRDTQYSNRVFPTVTADGIDLSGKTKEEVAAIWEEKNIAYQRAQFEFHLNSYVATVSGTDLNLGYDAALLGEQAYSVGRSGNFFSDILTKLSHPTIQLTPYFRWNDDVLQNNLTEMARSVDTPAQDALFQFNNGKVTQFKPAIAGQQVNKGLAIMQFKDILTRIPTEKRVVFPIILSIEPVPPQITTAKTNTMGIKETIGQGYSEFAGSIPGRIHNVVLASTRLNGAVIPPGGTISYNDLVGDISAATGYQQAYIIQNGHTILGDGGGICQVSTTLFRAALAAGLPILERHAHAYRVHYYEEGGFGPGLDATVFSPSVDLKIKNDTPGYILIQSHIDLTKPSLTIELFGTSDGRKSTVTTPQILSQTPPLPPLYQDDPTIPKGTVKQVDFEAWGAKTVFNYTVTRGQEQLQNQQFVSNFQPWQAVYLRGTM